MTYTCSYCNREVTRNKNGLKLVACYECKKERKRKRQAEITEKNKIENFCICGNKLYGSKLSCSVRCAGNYNKLLK